MMVNLTESVISNSVCMGSFDEKKISHPLNQRLINWKANAVFPCTFNTVYFSSTLVRINGFVYLYFRFYFFHFILFCYIAVICAQCNASCALSTPLGFENGSKCQVFVCTVLACYFPSMRTEPNRTEQCNS